MGCGQCSSPTPQLVFAPYPARPPSKARPSSPFAMSQTHHVHTHQHQQHQHQQQQHSQQHQQHQQQPQAQQQKAPALDWLSFPAAPAVVDAPHPDLFDFELDNSLSAFDQAQVQLLTLDYNDSFAFTNYRSETPQGPPSVITASSESAYETLSSYSESLNNYSNSSPGYNVVESSRPVDLNIDFAQYDPTLSADLNLANLALMDPTRDSAYSGLQYDRSGHAYDTTYDVSATRSTYSASSGYVPAPGSSTVPGHITNPGPHAANSESPKSSSDGGHGVGGDGDPRKKYPCPNCTRCELSRSIRLGSRR